MTLYTPIEPSWNLPVLFWNLVIKNNHVLEGGTHESWDGFMKVQFHFKFFLFEISTFVIAFLQNVIHGQSFYLRFLPSFLPFYEMLLMTKLEFSSAIDCFLWVSEKIGVVRFSVRIFLYGAFLFVVSIGNNVSLYKSVIKERTMLLSKVNKQIM
jgi:hypothetical protein